ncbi:hypothetical protein QP938_08175 [Porticoccaceae bacterium LTM1]|nr:hypothetical protein QP938_08175 [Porticoccaceae bacterium LTM1]
MLLKSQLLPQLFEGREVGDSLTVLDVGLANPDTVTFLSRYRTRLHCLDLYSEPVLTLQESDAGQKELRDEFHQILNFPAHTEFDICLLWDFPNYLNQTALRAFSEALMPWLSVNSLLHGFGIHKPGTVISSCHYGVTSPTEISVRSGEAGDALYPHRQGELSKEFRGLEVSRGTLLSNGKLEVLLKPEETLALKKANIFW